MDKKDLKATLKTATVGTKLKVESTDPMLDGTFTVKSVKLKRGHGGVDVTLGREDGTEVILSSVKNAAVVTSVGAEAVNVQVAPSA